VTATVAHSEVLGACRALFGAEVRVDPGFLARLDVDMVRRHFRRRAVEVHPDRAAVLRRPPAVLLEAFKQVEGAYRVLRTYLAAGKQFAALPGAAANRAASPSAPRPVPTSPQRTSAASATAGRSPPRASAFDADAAVVDHLWSGPIPSRRLRLGEYLYYSGRISWRELIRALVWQARQRPPFGQVASRLGFLTPELVVRVLSHRQMQERIGEAALRLRLMSGRERQVVLHAQQCGGRRLGDYFVQAGLLSSTDVDRLGRSVRAHNARVIVAPA
jgi:hypothetical protein